MRALTYKETVIATQAAIKKNLSLTFLSNDTLVNIYKNNTLENLAPELIFKGDVTSALIFIINYKT